MCSKLKEALEREDLTPEFRLILEECLVEQNEKETESENKEQLLEDIITGLEKLNYEKDKFFSIIAHDLRSPLCTLMGFSELLMADYEKMTLKDLRALAGQLNKSAENIFALLENLLEWSRMRTGKMKIDIKAICLDDEVLKTLSLYIDAAQIKGISIQSEVSSISAHCDHHMIESILRNLIGNAIKFCTKGDRVTITDKLFDGFAEVCVADTGIGMSEEILDGLFKLGSNVQRQGTNNEPSTGLGLLLCKEFVELHGGKIWATSEKGYGSKFYFTIPILPGKKKKVNQINKN